MPISFTSLSPFGCMHRLSTPPFLSVSCVRIPGLSASSMFSIFVPESSTLLSPSASGVFMSGLSNPLFLSTSDMRVPRLFAPSTSDMHMPGLSALFVPGMYVPGLSALSVSVVQISELSTLSVSSIREPRSSPPRLSPPFLI